MINEGLRRPNVCSQLRLWTVWTYNDYIIIEHKSGITANNT